LASTNEFALTLLSKSKPPEGTVISAYHQYDGRGQIGSKWESEAGANITQSIILYPNFLKALNQFLLNQAVSLAVYDLVSAHIPKPISIKWPNDIYVGKRKVAGILIQNTISGDNLNISVIGIGININQIVFLSNPPNPTSFKLETMHDFSIQNLAAQLHYCIEERYLSLLAGQSDKIFEEYLKNLFLLNVAAQFKLKNGDVTDGMITGVTEYGRLKVRTGQKEESFDIKEISLVLPGEQLDFINR
jgi:BirA family biotin operon repressor/biotin-[acetyl-CoA-carboxylase] ligase